MAYGNIYSNKGAMTPGASRETADGMSEEKIEQIIEAMRRERYRFAPARRVYMYVFGSPVEGHGGDRRGGRSRPRRWRR